MAGCIDYATHSIWATKNKIYNIVQSFEYASNLHLILYFVYDLG